MPHFHVRTSSTVTQDFIVKAGDRFAAQEIAQETADGIADGIAIGDKTIICVRTDSSDHVDVTEAEPGDWADAVKTTNKRAKGK